MLWRLWLASWAGRFCVVDEVLGPEGPVVGKRKIGSIWSMLVVMFYSETASMRVVFLVAVSLE